MPHLIDHVEVTNTTLVVKFLRTVKVSSIINDAFVLYEDTATPVDTPFKAIVIDDDYNSISRALTLYFAETLKPSTAYRLTATGLKDTGGTVIADESCDFETDESTTPTATDPLPPQVEPVEIEDHSIKAAVFTSADTIYAANPDFYIIETDPLEDEPLVTTDYNSGRVTITFSAFPANAFINTAYFKAQRKALQREFTRWENVVVQVSIDDEDPIVYVDFPSSDAIPLYNTVGKEYFPLGYKYRLRICKNVAI